METAPCCANHRSAPARSYVCPSAATTGSRITCPARIRSAPPAMPAGGALQIATVLARLQVAPWLVMAPLFREVWGGRAPHLQSDRVADHILQHVVVVSFALLFGLAAPAPARQQRLARRLG